ncbi:PREDICTED: F-box protein At5g65850-like [Camelina sativa]|uniref:F-box protein At5g65850-like n=1 Tax=Camelina sativa TaxID=90675 RepID=A0ABM0UQL1_CAMSA|nr:PREDICTED: F-box protein At5g65850-like [Camelina sativa]
MSVTEDRLPIISRRSKRTKISPNGVEENSFQIPIDLVFEILLRLPAKSVAACRCVSKLWGSLISRQDFTELFFTKSVHRPKLLFTCRKDGKLFFFSSPPDENSSADSLVSFSSSCRVSRPINGLVCLERDVKKTNETVRVICNPSTGQCLNLPKPTTTWSGLRIHNFFVYEPIEKQFKLLLSCGIHEHLVLTLGTGELSWRVIEPSKPHCIHRLSNICINGVLYYPATDMSSTDDIIVCFDVSSEKFRFITAIQGFIQAGHDGVLINYNGKLASLVSKRSRIVDRRSKSIELWVLQDVENQECIKHTYVLPTWWQDIVGTGCYTFVGVTRSKEFMFSPWYQTVPFYVFYFNIEKQTIRRAAIRGMEALQGHTVLTFLDHVENVKPLSLCFS